MVGGIFFSEMVTMGVEWCFLREMAIEPELMCLMLMAAVVDAGEVSFLTLLT